MHVSIIMPYFDAREYLSIISCYLAEHLIVIFKGIEVCMLISSHIVDLMIIHGVFSIMLLISNDTGLLFFIFKSFRFPTAIFIDLFTLI